LKDLYDEIWVYGLPQICDPLEGIALPPNVRQKMVYTGYLHRELPVRENAQQTRAITDKPYLLVTTGGGGDGEPAAGGRNSCPIARINRSRELRGRANRCRPSKLCVAAA
jgi:hypothetical protein